MKTLDEISTEFANFTYEKDAALVKGKIRKMIKFVETAAIETKKVSVSKKGPTYGNPSSLHHRGVWGYPQVFVAGEGVKKPVQVKHRCTFAPFQTFIKCRPRDRTYGYDVDMGDPAVPDFFTSLDEWRMLRGRHHTQDFGVWLAENCPALHDLDQRVRAAWGSFRYPHKEIVPADTDMPVVGNCTPASASSVAKKRPPPKCPGIQATALPKSVPSCPLPEESVATVPLLSSSLK